MMAKSSSSSRHLLWIVLVAILAYLFHDVSIVASFPTGAGSCLGGEPAVGGAHLDFGAASPSRRLGGNGTLAAANVTMRIGNTTMARPEITVFVPPGQDITWSLSAGRVPIRGFLVRLEAPNGTVTTAAITCGVNQIVATTCVAPIVGCSHRDNNDKFNATGRMRFDQITKGVKVDVTVVLQNNFRADGRDNTTASFYAYSRFIVDFDSVVDSGPFAAFFRVLREIILLIIAIFGFGGSTR
jgi:hypothetical protein